MFFQEPKIKIVRYVNPNETGIYIIENPMTYNTVAAISFTLLLNAYAKNVGRMIAVHGERKDKIPPTKAISTKTGKLKIIGFSISSEKC